MPKLLIKQIEDQKLRTFQTGTCFNNRNFDGFFPAKRKLSNAKSFNQSNGKSKTSFWYCWWINLAIFYCIICTVICLWFVMIFLKKQQPWRWRCRYHQHITIRKCFCINAAIFRGIARAWSNIFDGAFLRK